MNVILTGFMGTGKTCVGKRLAKRLGWRFVDLDELVEQAAKMPVARIFTERGEGVFRRMERRCIGRVIHGREQVIATGGGAFVDARNRSTLKVSGPVICLTAKPRVLMNRLGPKIQTRPLLAGRDPMGKIQALLHRRTKAYAQADWTVDTSALSVDEVVERVWEKLSLYLCRSWQYLVDHSKELARRYGGKYIVVADDRIVASGDTQLEAYQNACPRLTQTRDAGIYYIPVPDAPVPAR